MSTCWWPKKKTSQAIIKLNMTVNIINDCLNHAVYGLYNMSWKSTQQHLRYLSLASALHRAMRVIKVFNDPQNIT